EWTIACSLRARTYGRSGSRPVLLAASSSWRRACPRPATLPCPKMPKQPATSLRRSPSRSLHWFARKRTVAWATVSRTVPSFAPFVTAILPTAISLVLPLHADPRPRARGLDHRLQGLGRGHSVRERGLLLRPTLDGPQEHGELDDLAVVEAQHQRGAGLEPGVLTRPRTDVPDLRGLIRIRPPGGADQLSRTAEVPGEQPARAMDLDPVGVLLPGGDPAALEGDEHVVDRPDQRCDVVLVLHRCSRRVGVAESVAVDSGARHGEGPLVD